MKKNPKQHGSKQDPIPESVWNQIKTNSREPWREATFTALFGHRKKQSQKHTRVIQAGRTR